MTLQHTGIRALASRAWDILQRNWVLFALIVSETFLNIFILSGTGTGTNTLLIILMVYLHLAMLSGWFYQMKRVALIPEYRTSWGDFFSGVSLYAGRMLVGGSYLLLVCMAVFFVGTLVANFVVTPPSPEIISQLQGLATEGDNAKLWEYVQAEPTLQKPLMQAGAVLLASVSLLGLFLLSIFFWPYNVVLYDMKWREAWAYSRKFIAQAWRPLISLGAAWIGVHLLFLLSVLTGQIFLIMVTYVLYLLGKTLLPLMTTLFLVDYAPEQLSPIEVEAAP